jgi:hypothetical protein
MQKPRKNNANAVAAQSKRFIEAAKALECDDDKARFEKRLGKIAKTKPKEPASQK